MKPIKSLLSFSNFSLVSAILVIALAQRRCMPGSFSPTGLEPCFACPRGTYAVGFANKICTRCQAGQSTLIDWARNEGACTPCPKVDDDGTCKFCRPGYVRDNGIEGSGAREQCNICPPGTASPGGESSCQVCSFSAGFVTGGAGAPNCLTCPSKSAAHASDKCVRTNKKCRKYIGTSSSTAIPSKCRLCPPGSFSKNGRGNCTPCPRGTFAEGFGTKGGCMPCKFQSTTLFSGARAVGTCESSAGNFPFPTRSVSPSPTPPKTSSVCVGGLEPQGNGCAQCQPGFFKPAAGSAACQPCPEDQFQDLAGQTSCKACGEDEISDGTSGATRCIPCPNDRFLLKKASKILRNLRALNL